MRWPKAGIALALSDRECFTGKKKVWEQVSLPGFHSPWKHSSSPQIGVSERNPRNALRYHQVKPGYPQLDQTNNAGQELTLFFVSHGEPHQLPLERTTWHLADTLWSSRQHNSPKRSTSTDRANGCVPVSSNSYTGVCNRPCRASLKAV